MVSDSEIFSGRSYEDVCTAISVEVACGGNRGPESVVCVCTIDSGVRLAENRRQPGSNITPAAKQEDPAAVRGGLAVEQAGAKDDVVSSVVVDVCHYHLVSFLVISCGLIVIAITLYFLDKGLFLTNYVVFRHHD